MIKYKSIECCTPNCTNKVLNRVDGKYKSHYCKTCKTSYPLSILRLQTEYGVLMPDLLMEVSKTFNFHSGEFIASILKVSRKKLIEWLSEYLGIRSWSEFKKKYSCKSSTCYIINSSSFFHSKYNNKYYLIQKLHREFGLCACLYRLSEYENYSSRQRILKFLNKEQKIMINITDPAQLAELQKATIESN